MSTSQEKFKALGNLYRTGYRYGNQNLVGSGGSGGGGGGGGGADEIPLPDGSAGTPSLNFQNDLDLGLYRSGADTMGVSAGGVNKMSVGTDQITLTVPLQAPNGSDLNPSIVGSSDPDSGILFPADDTVAIATDGTRRLTVGSSNITSTLPIRAPDGSVSVPSHSFSNFQNSGLFHTASILGVAHNGTTQLSVSDTLDEQVTVSNSLRVGGNIKMAGSVANRNTLVSDASGIFSPQPLNVNDLGDATITTPSNGQVLQYNSGTWVNATPSATIPALTVDPGTLSNPSIAWSDNLDTGFNKLAGVDVIQAVINGAQVGGWSSTEFGHTSLIVAPVFNTLSDGTAGAPVYSNVNDLNSGLFFPSADTVAVSTGGTQRLTVNTTGVSSTLPFLAPAGTVSAPGLSFSGSPTNGVYLPTTNTVGITTNGVNRVNVNTASVTSTLPFLAPDGTVGSPSISIASNPNTGLYSPGGNILGFSAGGQNRAQLQAAGLIMGTGVVIQNVGGSAAAPSYTFSGDTNSGFYSPSGDQVAISTNGVNRFNVNTTQIDTALQIRVGGGSSPGAPNYTFATDIDSGMYTNGANSVGIATGGVARSIFANTSITNTVPLLNPPGTNTAPSYTFSTATGSGMYVSGSDLNFSVGASNKLTLNSSNVITTSAFNAPAFSASAPTYAFTGDNDTGMFSPGANRVGLSSGTVKTLDLSATETAVGGGASAAGVAATALGHSATASGLTSTSLGEASQATATDAVALGNGAQATASGAYSLAPGAVANISSSYFINSGTPVPSSGVNLIFKADGQIGPVSSSIRYKTDVREAPTPTNIDQLRVVEFKYKNDPHEKHQLGLIAEECVGKLHESLIPLDLEGDPMGISYDRLSCLLLQEIQSLRRRLALLENKPLPEPEPYVPVKEEDLYPPEKLFNERMALEKVQTVQGTIMRKANALESKIKETPELKETLLNNVEAEVKALVEEREAVRAEKLRLAEEAKLAEEARLAEEAKLEHEANEVIRLAEEAEHARLAEEAQKAEEATEELKEE